MSVCSEVIVFLLSCDLLFSLFFFTALLVSLCTVTVLVLNTLAYSRTRVTIDRLLSVCLRCFLLIIFILVWGMPTPTSPGALTSNSLRLLDLTRKPLWDLILRLGQRCFPVSFCHDLRCSACIPWSPSVWTSWLLAGLHSLSNLLCCTVGALAQLSLPAFLCQAFFTYCTSNNNYWYKMVAMVKSCPTCLCLPATSPVRYSSAHCHVYWATSAS